MCKLFRELLSIVILLLLWSFPVNISSQSINPIITFYSLEDDEDVEMTEGESMVAQAPLKLSCKANISGTDSYTYTCEWRFFDSQIGEEKPLLTRFDEDTEYTLEKSGSYGIKLYVTFKDANDNTIDVESEVFTIVISESELSCPDGFSPNGDGINDIYKIEYKSIIKLQAAIFNRWGQKIHTMNLENVDKGWDGRRGGDYVKDGVYYINLNAIGSDGVEYKIKKAINVLKGFKETDGTDV